MKTNTLRVLIAGAAFLPAVAFSAPPVAYGDGWSLSAGVISLTGAGNGGCPTGFTCSATPISDVGFMQVQMTDDNTGESFFRTIVADGEGVGVEQFRTESFVVAGSTNGGIATQQTLASPDVPAGAGTMQAVSTIDTGNFGPGYVPGVTPGGSSIVLEQDVNSGNFNTGFQYNATLDDAGVGTATMRLAQANQDGAYTDNFAYVQDTTIAGGASTVVGKAMDITSTVVLDGPTTTGDQNFGYTLREGSYMTPTTGTTSLIAGDSGLGVQTITWTGATDVERVLVGQSMSGVGSFGYERLADTDEQIATFDLANATGLEVAGGADPFSPTLGGIVFSADLPLIP